MRRRPSTCISTTMTGGKNASTDQRTHGKNHTEDIRKNTTTKHIRPKLKGLMRITNRNVTTQNKRMIKSLPLKKTIKTPTSDGRKWNSSH